MYTKHIYFFVLLLIKLTMNSKNYCLAYITVNNTIVEIKLGFVSPTFGDLGYGRTAAAATMAIEKAHKDGFLKNINISIIWRNGGCDAKLALGTTVDLRITNDVDAYIGLPCSIASINAGRLISYWNLPHFSYSSTDPILADKVVYSTFIRTISPFNKLAMALMVVMKTMNWKLVSMMTMPDALNYCDYASRALENAFFDNNITLADWVRDDKIADDNRINDWLDRLKTRSRIIIICVGEEQMRRVMILASKKQMTNGQYMFIEPTLLPFEKYKQPWKMGDKDDTIAKQAFRYVFQMALGLVRTPAAEEFRKRVVVEVTKPPWDKINTGEVNSIGSLFSLFCHDAVYLYCMAIDKLIKNAQNIRNGTLVYHTAKGIVFDGISGEVHLDNIGDRIGEYWLWHLPRNSDEFVLWAKLAADKMTSKYKIEITGTRWWSDLTGYNPPADKPSCGFFEENCQVMANDSEKIVVAVSVVVVVVGLFLLVFVAVILYRRHKFEDEINQMLWKLKFEDLEFDSKLNSTGSIMTTTGGLSSVNTDENNSTDFSVSGRVLMLQNKNKLASYKGTTVVVKELKSSAIYLNRSDHIELKAMREMNHDNINTFVGACVDPPNLCTVTKFCLKGSLEDIISNDSVKLDAMFQNSLVFDLINGIDYIQHSILKSHGNLKSSSCLIDGRWVLKICDYGLKAFKESEENENELFNNLLWTAPELLRKTSPPPYGTQRGDIYSFAIILQEILYRSPPYCADGSSVRVAKDLIGRVRNGETPPFRPICPANDKVDQRLLSLMRDCWMEDEVNRPDIAAVKSKFNQINKGKKFNIMDNMLRMMEKYATNLEGLVDQRTRELVEEKKKTDLLLYKMLPSTVADNLKSGTVVEPELFKEASVYFSDIVSFTKMCSESTPLQVVTFLNDLWMLFDDITAKYQVYKVETIGDAYMCASGIPVSIGKLHASEIAKLAINIRQQVSLFKISHKPNTPLEVRIGIHAGPVVAGVIGATMPRYCLFGDTVNTASRMESTGEPMKIHLSEEAVHAMRSCMENFRFVKRGETAVKGKGMVTTYWLEEPLHNQIEEN